MSLASFLREKISGFEASITDMLPDRVDVEQAVRRALEFEPEVLGLSAVTMEGVEMHELARAAKKLRPDLPIVAGGPHPTTAPRDTLSNEAIDLIVRGEGELTFAELLPGLLAGERKPGDVAGIGFRENGDVRLNPLREEIVDLDSMPLPAYDLITLENYWEMLRFGTTYARKEYATLSTSRACPYRCTYCHRIFGTRYRAQSPETVLRDLATLAEDFGAREILFVDDCFNLDKKRVAAICDGIVERGLDFTISFPNGIRGDIMDRATLEKLKAAGTYRVTYAIETASPRMQRFIKKNVKLDRLKRVIEETDGLDIMVDGFFMVGFPGETRAEVQRTLDYALESRLHTANFWFVTPFEGTELFEQARELGFTVTSGHKHMHYIDPSTDLSEVPPPQLKKMLQKTFLKFYLNPWRLWRIWKLFPNKLQLPSLLWRFIKISATWNS